MGTNIIPVFVIPIRHYYVTQSYSFCSAKFSFTHFMYVPTFAGLLKKHVQIAVLLQLDVARVVHGHFGHYVLTK